MTWQRKPEETHCTKDCLSVREDKLPDTLEGPPLKSCKVRVRQSCVQVTSEYRKKNYKSNNKLFRSVSNTTKHYINRQNQNRSIKDDIGKSSASTQSPSSNSQTSIRQQERGPQAINLSTTAESENDFLDLIDLK